MTDRTMSAALRGLALAALLAAAAVTTASAAERAVRSAATLPTLADVTRAALPANAIVARSDTFLVSSHGFQDLRGACDTRGWTGEDRSATVYPHVQEQLVVNEAYFIGKGGLPSSLPCASDTPIWPGKALAALPGGELAFVLGSDNAPQVLALDPAAHSLREWTAFPGFVSSGPTAMLYTRFGLMISFAGEGLYVCAPTPIQLGMGSEPADTTLGTAYFCPMAMAADAAGNIYFTDCDGRVRVVRTDNRVVTLAGVPPLSAVTDTADGLPATAVRLNAPGGVAVDPAGTRLYIAESGRYRIRVVDLATGIIGTLLGDGTPTTLATPKLLAMDASGALFATLGNDRVVRIVDGVVTPIAGGGPMYAPSTGIASALQQRLRSVSSLVPDGSGGVYFTDSELIFHLDAAGALACVAGRPIGLAMGARSLWFGADAASHPAEVSNWVRTSGYGGAWSQRFTSPVLDLSGHPNAALSFDGVLHLTGDGYIGAGIQQANEWLLVQARINGNWTDLIVEYANVTGSPLSMFTIGYGRFKAWASLAPPSGSYDQIRFIVQTTASGNAEDGLGPDAPDGPLVLDNVRITDSGTDLTPPLDFEDGGLGGWTLSAVNGVCTTASWMPMTLRYAASATDVTLQTGADFTDPSCAWMFLAPGDSVNHPHPFARLASPWMALAPGDSSLLVTFSGKLATINATRLLTCWVRGKNAGDTHPRSASKSNFAYNSGTYGGDVSSPFLQQRVLRFPEDFQNARAADSVQVVYDVWDDDENQDAFAWPAGVSRILGSKLPFLDDLRVYQLRVDRDYDGVADASDACPDACAAGQDADGDGCPEPTATLRHVESWDAAELPLHVAISAHGDPRIGDGSDLAAIQQGYLAWTLVPGVNLPVIVDPPTAQTNASSYDGINLVTFEDDYVFPPNVIAITPTLSALRRTAFGDRIVLPGQIVDSDMMLNPAIPFRTDSYDPGPGSIDLQSVVTHEAGHFYGLSHSGVLKSTMFFVLLSGQEARTLEADDRAAIAAAYPDGTFEIGTATVTGTVTRGGGGTPIPGALVTAVRLDAGGSPADSVASDYTDEDGAYALRGLAPGSYSVRITPLDGEVGGYGLTPDYISERVYAIAQTNFAAEWWCAPESDRDTDAQRGTLVLAAGQVRANVNVVTNVDTVAPAVVSVSPADGAANLAIDTPVLINFSERIESSTINGNVRLHDAAGSGTLGMAGKLVNNGRSLVLTPSAALAFGTAYTVEVLTGLTDREGVPLAAAFAASFTTEPAPPITITAVTPQPVYTNSYVTIVGTGFDPNGADSVWFSVGAPTERGGLPIEASSVSPTTMVARVPLSAISGPLRVEVNGQPSNVLTPSILPPPPVTAPSSAGNVPLTFAPSDVALTPDGTYAFAVGTGGIAAVEVGANSPQIGNIGAAQSIALSSDGHTAVVTRPGAAEVVRVATDPSNPGTFLQVVGRTHLPPGAQPNGVALAPDASSAYVTDRDARLVYRIDLRPGATQDSVIAEYADSTWAPGAAAVSADGRTLVLAGSGGPRTVELASGMVLAGAPLGPAMGGVATSPNEYLFAGFGLIGNQVGFAWWADPPAPLVTEGSIVLGGEPRDVTFAPDGRAAYVTNAGYDLLQVVDTDRLSSRFHTKIAEVGTGHLPVAVAVSASGGVLAVANQASQSIGLYYTGGTAALVRAVSPVGHPGQVVALHGSGGALATGSQVDLGDGPFAASFTAGDQGAFVVPEGAQRDVSLAAIDASGHRTLAIPFRVVDPIATPVPRVTGFGVGLDSVLAGAPVWYPPSTIRYLDVSPDERMIVLARDLDAQTVVLDLLAADGKGPTRMGGGRLEMQVTGPGDAWLGGSFTADGKYFWYSATTMMTNILDADPSSLGFGMGVGSISGGALGPIAADPLGRYMIQGERFATDSLRIYTPTGGPVGSVPVPSPTLALAVSPDGRWVVAAGGTRVNVASLGDTFGLTSTVSHVTAAAEDWDIAITTDGKRAVVKFPGRATGSLQPQWVGVYNLDPQAGAIGQELWYGAPWGASEYETYVADAEPAPDGRRVLFSLGTARDSLVLFDPTTIPPGLTYLPTRGMGPMAISGDGARLWTEANAGTTRDSVRLVSLGPASALAIVSGNNQSGLSGQWLASPLVFRVTDAQGRPRAGAVLRFEGGRYGSRPILDDWDCPLWHETDANGEVSVRWRLPSGEYGPDTLLVTLLGAGTQVRAVADSRMSEDQLPPAIVSLAPQHGATGLSASTAVSVTFNKVMQAASVASHVTLHQAGNPLPGSFSDVQGKTFIFQPAQPLAFAARCSLVVASGILDTYGLTTAEERFAAFTVQSPPALHITSVSPPAGKVGIPVVVAGDGFSAVQGQNTVLFNGTVAGVSNADAASLTAVVPLAATSGPVTVQSAGVESNSLSFFVLEDNPGPGGVISSVPGGDGVRDVAITQDGLRAYVVNPTSNSVTALDIPNATTLTGITVGLQPRALALLPDDSRAYVANTGSNDVSVIDIAPASAAYHTVVATIPVANAPVDVAVSAIGPKVLVVSATADGLSIIDANPAHATFDQVTAVVNVGSTGGQSVVVSPDGTRAFVGTTTDSLFVIDLNTDAVTAVVNVGSTGGQTVVVSPDGTTLFVLCADGMLRIVDIAPGSSHEYQVTAVVNVGSTGGQTVVVSPDGALLYVTDESGQVIVFSITRSDVPGASVITPGPSVVLTPLTTIPVGADPAGIAVDPLGHFALVCNSGDGTISIIGFPGTLPSLHAAFDFDPGTLNLKAMGRWVTGYLEPPAPRDPADIVLSSIRLNGVVPCDTIGLVGDHDADGLPDLMVKFDRQAVELAVPTGDRVALTVTGLIGTRTFTGADTIRVKRPKVTAPAAQQQVVPGAAFTVRWEVPEDVVTQWVAVLHTVDRGLSWTIDASRLPNTGTFAWTAPMQVVDSVRIAVVLVESSDAAGDSVTGCLGVSEPFDLNGATAVEPAPAALAFERVRPNPAAGRALMRFGLPRAATVSLDVYDVLGRRVRNLAAGPLPAGWHEVRWDGRAEGGSTLRAGLYFVRFRAEGRTFDQRLVWLR